MVAKRATFILFDVYDICSLWALSLKMIEVIRHLDLRVVLGDGGNGQECRRMLDQLNGCGYVTCLLLGHAEASWKFNRRVVWIVAWITDVIIHSQSVLLARTRLESYSVKWTEEYQWDTRLIGTFPRSPATFLGRTPVLFNFIRPWVAGAMMMRIETRYYMIVKSVDQAGRLNLPLRVSRDKTRWESLGHTLVLTKWRRVAEVYPQWWFVRRCSRLITRQAPLHWFLFSYLCFVSDLLSACCRCILW